MRIYTLGEEILRKKAQPVEEVNDEIRALVDEMFTIMIAGDGVGLAGPQVGKGLRLFVIMADDGIRRVYINPQIISTSPELVEYEEGCLSIPKIYETIKRPARVTVQALNERGKPFTQEADGLLARVIQHENDHLDGVLFIDRGDRKFAEKTTETFKKHAERAEKKKAEKRAKKKSITDKLAAKKIKKENS
ncbi:MAG: peptide deformylase [Treponema sp.]|jgi:peptide deformylase|nr:peptide deformylase [Treponema sp.]